jgi:acetyl-CoA C-acetyltransferase
VTVHVIGAAMSPQGRLPDSAAALGRQAATLALDDAGLSPSDVEMVIFANALGGALCDQGSIRGQSWLGALELEGTPVVNVDNSCGSASAALHVGLTAATAGPVLVVAAEKMWVGHREATIAAVEDGIEATDRARRRDELGESGGTVLMKLNAEWAKTLMEERGVTREHLAAAAAKCYAHARLNPLVAHHRDVDIDDVLNSPLVNEPLTRLMCSGHSDGAAAVVITTEPDERAPRIRASASMSGDGSGEWHARMAACADRVWEQSGVDPAELDLVEVHDATSGEEIWAAEAIGAYGFGEAGPAALKGMSAIGGDGVTVNPSGGLVGRGHPVGATGLCQLVEVVTQLRDRAGPRQVEGARLGAAVNCGGVLGPDLAWVNVTLVEAASTS